MKCTWITDKAAVMATIDAAEGPRITARTLDYPSILRAVAEAENRLTHLPKTHRTGLQIRISDGSHVPNSYHGIAARTYAILVWASKGWALTEAGREPATSNSGGRRGPLVQTIILTAEQARIMQQHFLRSVRCEVMAQPGPAISSVPVSMDSSTMTTTEGHPS